LNAVQDHGPRTRAWRLQCTQRRKVWKERGWCMLLCSRKKSQVHQAACHWANKRFPTDCLIPLNGAPASISVHLSGLSRCPANFFYAVCSERLVSCVTAAVFVLPQFWRIGERQLAKKKWSHLIDLRSCSFFIFQFSPFSASTISRQLPTKFPYGAILMRAPPKNAVIHG